MLRASTEKKIHLAKKKYGFLDYSRGLVIIQTDVSQK